MSSLLNKIKGRHSLTNTIAIALIVLAFAGAWIAIPDQDQDIISGILGLFGLSLTGGAIYMATSAWRKRSVIGFRNRASLWAFMLGMISLGFVLWAGFGLDAFLPAGHEMAEIPLFRGILGVALVGAMGLGLISIAVEEKRDNPLFRIGDVA
ncbi:MAG: hypothetical protein WC045_02555 [Patescibacteria group bacterium]